MTPVKLTAASFDSYPEAGKTVAVDHLNELLLLPAPVLAFFLTELLRFETKFPVERDQIVKQLDAIGRLSSKQRRELILPFDAMVLSSELEQFDFVSDPVHYVERLTPYLWSTGQIDVYRQAARGLIEGLAIAPAQPRGRRFVAIFTAAELAASEYPIFQKVKKLGLHATNVNESRGESYLSDLLAQRARSVRGTYSHWWLDTHGALDCPEGVVSISYQKAEPIRRSIVSTMQHAVASGTGPEALRSRLVSLSPYECDAAAVSSDPLLQRFIVDLFADGSGTQVYSTSFAQWGMRQILRRAQPETLYTRIGARVQQRSLNDLIAGRTDQHDKDAHGSLIDADLAAYYTWLELERLTRADEAVFLAWFPAHRQAFLIGPGVPKGVSTQNSLTIPELLGMSGLQDAPA